MLIPGLAFVVLLGVAWWATSGRPSREEARDDSSRGSAPALAERQFANTPATHPHAAAGEAAPGNQNVPPAAPVETAEERNLRIMASWRQAILNRDAETVEALDRTFAAMPSELVPPLMVSAQTDENERVRAFSTRVLGKLRAEESRQLLRRLLEDRSQYVRYNAAWALGQIADRASVARLRTLARKDPSPEVRKSAEDSLRDLGGG